MSKKKSEYFKVDLSPIGPTKNLSEKLEKFYIGMKKKGITPMAILLDVETYVELVSEKGVNVKFTEATFTNHPGTWPGLLATDISPTFSVFMDPLLRRGDQRIFVKKSKRNPKTGYSWISSLMVQEKGLQELNYIV